MEPVEFTSFLTW